MKRKFLREKDCDYPSYKSHGTVGAASTKPAYTTSRSERWQPERKSRTTPQRLFAQRYFTNQDSSYFVYEHMTCQWTETNVSFTRIDLLVVFRCIVWVRVILVPVGSPYPCFIATSQTLYSCSCASTAGSSDVCVRLSSLHCIPSTKLTYLQWVWWPRGLDLWPQFHYADWVLLKPARLIAELLTHSRRTNMWNHYWMHLESSILVPFFKMMPCENLKDLQGLRWSHRICRGFRKKFEILGMHKESWCTLPPLYT